MVLLLKFTKSILIIAILFGSEISYPGEVTAKTPLPAASKKPPSPQRSTSKPVFVWSKPPSGLSTIPGRSTGMGSRENCPQVKIPLTALVPFKERSSKTKQKDNSAPMDVWGLTTAERPSFWFYMPYTKDFTNLSAEFVLQDRDENDVYRQTISAVSSLTTLPSKPGIIGVSLPANVPPLQVGKTYRWYFKVHCGQQQTGNSLVQVEGDIQRITLPSDVKKQLEAATEQQQKVAIYAASGIWFDALTMLAKSRLANPKDASLVTDWQSLLQSVNLQELATIPVIN